MISAERQYDISGPYTAIVIITIIHAILKMTAVLYAFKYFIVTGDLEKTEILYSV